MEKLYKECNKCGITKPVEYFCKRGKDRNGNVKYRNLCKDCYNTNWKYRILISIDTVVRESERKGTVGERITTVFLESLKQKQGGKCHWLGIDMDFTRKNRLFAPSLDRLDPSRGYERDNVVLTTMFANLGRGDSSEVDMRNFIDTLMKLHLANN